MAIFRKKKYKENEKELEEERPRRQKIRSTDFRSRKKKEPIKVWGRKERLIVLIVLLLTIGTSVFLAFSSRAWKLPGLPRLKMPSFNLSFFGEEKIVIEGNRDRTREREKSEEVINAFKEKTRKLSGVYGLCVVSLDNNYSYGFNENDVFEPASLNKLPVMMAMYIEAEKGNIDLESKYKLNSSDRVEGAGSLYGKPDGYEISYRHLIRLMGKESDNTAFGIARNILGKEKIEGVIDEIGMKETVIFGEDQKTTPYDIGLFFKKLWQGNLIPDNYRDEILAYLTDTIYESWIPEGMPDNVSIAHKFGRERHVVNDAGIVFADKPFVLVIMSKGVVEREADEMFPELARLVFDIETKE